MAKQRGVVQLSGRVDNLCYYQQKRVRGGLVRRVNLAMSDRVKVGAEYQRLRSANSYYGGCSMCAAAILNMTGTRAKFLHLPDRQAIFTKEIRNVQRYLYPDLLDDTISFGLNSASQIPYAYDRIVKNKMSKFMPSVPYYLLDTEVDSVITIVIPANELTNYCTYNNSIGILFNVVYECFLYGISRDAITGKFPSPESGCKVQRQPLTWKLNSGDLTISFNRGDIDDAFCFAIISALPIINDIGGRMVTKNTGATCRMIGFR